MDSQKYYVPRYLDEPMRLMLWTWDELAVFLFPLLVLYTLTNQMLIGLLVGVALFFALKKIKKQDGHLLIKSLAYWYLPAIIRFRVTPASHQRFYRG